MRSRPTPRRSGRLIVWALLGVLCAHGRAQQLPVPTDVSPSAGSPSNGSPASGDPLPEAPSPQSQGSIAGIVTDSEDALLPGAHVTLKLTASSEEHTAVTSDDGLFSFTNIPAGAYKITITSDGLAPFQTDGLLHPGEELQLPQFFLGMASTNTNVDVVLSRHDQVEVEVKAEEKQRIVGAIPNFFVSYNWHASPLSAGQKYELAWRSVVDPVTFVFNGAVAGLQQAQGDFKGYGQGAMGYAKRYGASFADNASGTILGGAVLPSLLHQDPRYFFKGTGSITSRTLYALSTAVICRGDNGRWQPNYSSVLGDIAAGGISNLYYPKSDRHGWTLTLENGIISSLYDGVSNVIQEFLINRLTPGAPHGGTVRP